MMWTFIGGLFAGAIMGVVVIAAISAKDPVEDELFIKANRIRKLAVDTEIDANATDDPLKKAEAEGMWEAVRILYGNI